MNEALDALLARPRPSSGRVLPQLDALRGVAIVAVFAQHVGDRMPPDAAASIERHLPLAAPWILTTLRHAWWGVDLFFVLSGFSLALGYLRRDIPARVFLARRAARILPAFWVALLVVLAFKPALVAAPRFAASALAHFFMLHGYTSPGGIVLIGAAWSLTTEAHFYLVLPLLAGALFRGSLARRAAIGGALCLACWCVRALLHDAFLDPAGANPLLEASQRHWIVSRIDQFVLGALAANVHVAVARSAWAARVARAAPWLVAVSIAALIGTFRLEGATFFERGGAWGYAPLSIATTLLVLAAVSCDERATRVIAPAPLCAVGVASYGIFLYHQLVLELVGRAFGPGPMTVSRVLVEASFALPLAIAAGAASWRAIERPALAWAPHPPSPLPHGRGEIAAGKPLSRLGEGLG